MNKDEVSLYLIRLKCLIPLCSNEFS